MNIEKLGIITHEDFDGMVAKEVLERFLNIKIESEYSFNPTSKETLSLYLKLKEKKEIKTLFILDREINDQDLQEILKDDIEIIHIDHHLNFRNQENSCIKYYYGTNLLVNNKAACELVVEFCENELSKYKSIDCIEWMKLKEFVMVVSDWDTFRWKNLPKKNQKMAYQLQSIEKNLGIRKALKEIKKRCFGRLEINNSFKRFAEKNEEIYNQNLELEYKKKLENIEYEVVNHIKYGILYDVKFEFISVICNKILSENKDISFILCAYKNGLISARGLNGNNRVILSDLMKSYKGDGGGHHNAAGGLLYEKLEEAKYGNLNKKKVIRDLKKYTNNFLKKY